MSETQALQQVVSRGGLVQLEPRTYQLDGPIRLPPVPTLITGVREATVLTWPAGDGLVGDYPGYYGRMPLTIRDLSLAVDGIGGAALRLSWPDAGSVNEPTVILESVTIRPAHWTAQGRAWRTPIVLTNAWCARLRDLAIHGDNHDADSMETAIRCAGWSTGVHISETVIYGGQTGIRFEASAVGHVEGPMLHRLEMVGVGIGVYAHGALPGGRPVPWLTLSDSHINARTHGVFLVGRAQGSLIGNLIYGVPQHKATFVGLYLAAQSHHTRVIGNQVYVLGQGGVSYGILVDQSHGGTLVGNVLTDATLGIWLTPSSGGWQLAANAVSGHQWGQDTQGVINQGANP